MMNPVEGKGTLCIMFTWTLVFVKEIEELRVVMKLTFIVLGLDAETWVLQFWISLFPVII